jgi:lysozyme
MKLQLRLSPVVLTIAVAACGPEVDQGNSMRAGDVPGEATDSSAITRVCTPANTLPGIDVSYYNDTIDWDTVKSQGVAFAFIRVSDGLSHFDSQFARNWSEARRVGIKRGVYQLFRPNLDPVAQADLLLENMGQLQPGDLPPVIDVEATGGRSPSGVASQVKAWLDHVKSALGVSPIIYTGPYFWRDSVGGPSFSSDYVLWIAHYGTSCPLVPDPWTQWTFHQYDEHGRMSGLPGDVDMDLFAGTQADLDALGVGGNPPPPPPSCASIAASGGVVTEDCACVKLGGPKQYLRTATGGYNGGSYVWTYATSSNQTVSSATYTLHFDTAGPYHLEAYVASGTSKQTRYDIAHDGSSSEVIVDQSAKNGFADLGTYTFQAGTDYSVVVPDNTGEADSLNRRIVYDALRATPAQNPNPNPNPNTCSPIPAQGTVLEEDNSCAQLGGPAQSFTAESTGSNGSHLWVPTTAAQTPLNFVSWNLGFAQAGLYHVEAYVEGAGANSKETKYVVTHSAGHDEVYLDQSTAAGYVELGNFNFDVSGSFGVRLDDNTGEDPSLGRRVIFDAVRVTPIANVPCKTITLSSGTTALNVRPHPNTLHNALTQLSAGQSVARLASVSGQLVIDNTTWHRISVGQIIGYVAAHYTTCQ